jgi:hypothetical protein
MDSGSTPSRLLGPELWQTIQGIPFTTWDLWLLVMSLTAERIGFDGVERKLQERSRLAGGFARNDCEAKLAQLDDLRERLTKLNVRPEQLALEQAQTARVVNKARIKLFEQTVPEAHYTKAMRERFVRPRS